MSTTPVLQIRNNGQITLPTSVRKKSNLKTGDLLEVNIEDDGSIRLTPQMAIDRSQAYFWSERWQKGEQQAEKEVKTGKVKKFDHIDALVNDLESNP